jgi:hypothetical protein
MSFSYFIFTVLFVVFSSGASFSDTAINSNSEEKTFEEFRKKLFSEESLRKELQQNYSTAGDRNKNNKGPMLTDEDFEVILEGGNVVGVPGEKNTKAAIVGGKNMGSAGSAIDEKKNTAVDLEDNSRPKIENEVENQTKDDQGTKTKPENENGDGRGIPADEREEQGLKIMEKKKKRKKKKKKAVAEEEKAETVAEVQEEKETKAENTAGNTAAVDRETKVLQPTVTAEEEAKEGKIIAGNPEETKEKIATEATESEGIVPENAALVGAEKSVTKIEPRTNGYGTKVLEKLKIKTKAEKLREKQEKELLEGEKSEEKKTEAETTEKTKEEIEDKSATADEKINVPTKSEEIVKGKNSEDSRNTPRRNSVNSEDIKTLIPEIVDRKTEGAKDGEDKNVGMKLNIITTDTSRRNSANLKVLGDELQKTMDKNRQRKDDALDNSATVAVDSKKKTGETAEEESPGVMEKVYSNITDTGISEEFLYSKEYMDLLDKSSKVELKKTNANSEKDIPMLYSVNKAIVTFRTSDISEELLSYRRTEANSHIPTIFKNEDIREMAKKAILQNDLTALLGVMEETRDPDFLVDEDKTLLSFSVENNSYILTRYLIYRGASINEPNSDMDTPLHIATNIGSVEMVKLLIENGANINSQNILGETPLMLAIVKNYEDVIYTLLKNGADVDTKNNLGETAYTLCLKYNRKKIQQYLVNVLRAEAVRK